MAGRGFNTFHGLDQGPPPPGFPGGHQTYFAQPAQYQYQPPYIPQFHCTPYNQPPFSQFSAGPPVTDGGFPGLNIKNAGGGVGVPVGYNYLFPQEHCHIHVFNGEIAPWQQPLYLNQTNHVKFVVPAIVSTCAATFHSYARF